jgi:hypothetical protein
MSHTTRRTVPRVNARLQTRGQGTGRRFTVGPVLARDSPPAASGRPSRFPSSPASRSRSKEQGSPISMPSFAVAAARGWGARAKAWMPPLYTSGHAEPTPSSSWMPGRRRWRVGASRCRRRRRRGRGEALTPTHTGHGAAILAHAGCGVPSTSARVHPGAQRASILLSSTVPTVRQFSQSWSAFKTQDLRPFGRAPTIARPLHVRVRQ